MPPPQLPNQRSVGPHFSEVQPERLARRSQAEVVAQERNMVVFAKKTEHL
jgi:hypothetical protein